MLGMDRPQSISTSTSLVYPTGCDGQGRFRRMINDNLKRLRCAANGTCKVNTKVSSCTNVERNRRSPPDVKVEITLSSDLSNVGDLKLDELFANKVGKFLSWRHNTSIGECCYGELSSTLSFLVMLFF